MVIKKNFLHHPKSKKSAWSAFALGAFTFVQLAAVISSEQIPAAYAQSYTDDDVNSYAQAVLAIESTRKVAFEEASDIMTSAGSELDILSTPLNCTANRMADMPDIDKASKIELRTILVTFCNGASTLAEENGLTPQRFNEITQAHRDDSELADRIKAAM